MPLANPVGLKGPENPFQKPDDEEDDSQDEGDVNKTAEAEGEQTKRP